ncbi:MAG TPA: AI-2E family transporter [Candidatus Binataceae bacterium]|jgi:predicted PurR-regulated permease PerM/methylmalonyl-CoA mutase cobalamin-binding subunit
MPSSEASETSSPQLQLEDEGAAAGASRSLLGIIITTAVLYLAKDILMPLAMAAILAVIFSNIASRLERFIGRFASSALVVATVVFAIVALTYFLAVQLTAVAVGVTDHSENIARKINAVQRTTPEWLAHIEYGVKNIEQQLHEAEPRPKQHTPTMVQAPTGSSTVDQVLKPVLPVLSDLTDGLLIIVLFFFLLYGREDLRYRLVRLTARIRVTLAAEAIATAGSTVSHYLLLFSLVNFGYGSSIAVVMWALGLPNPVFWGALAFLLRFIPYVGALISAVLPTLVAFAVFPGWSKTVEVFGAFILLDQVAGQFVEPILIGHGIGLSPLALLVSAMFWAWLWGLPGLLLATPLTSCLKVAGDYIPALSFLSILLGADKGREDYHDYYRKLLEVDQPGARALAVRHCDENGLEPTLVDVILPALAMMGQERAEDHIGPENQKFIVDTTDQLIGELGGRFIRPLLTPRIRLLGVCAPGDTHTLGLKILLELFRQDGVAATFIDEGKTTEEIVEFAKRFMPNIICLSCIFSDCIPAALELVRGLKAVLPDQIILAGGNAAIEHASELLAAGCYELSSTREQARRTVRRYALQRARSRLGVAGRLLPGFTLTFESNQNAKSDNALSDGPLVVKE